MAKKKDRKKAAEKIAAKAKAKKKEKKKVKAKKEKAKSKKVKIKGKKVKTGSIEKTGMVKDNTPITTHSSYKPVDKSSLSVNALKAISIIRNLKTITLVNDYIEGDERITVKKAAASRIAALTNN